MRKNACNSIIKKFCTAESNKKEPFTTFHFCANSLLEGTITKYCVFYLKSLFCFTPLAYLTAKLLIQLLLTSVGRHTYIVVEWINWENGRDVIFVSLTDLSLFLSFLNWVGCMRKDIYSNGLAHYFITIFLNPFTTPTTLLTTN